VAEEEIVECPDICVGALSDDIDGSVGMEELSEGRKGIFWQLPV